jgi:hypothetical protein
MASATMARRLRVQHGRQCAQHKVTHMPRTVGATSTTDEVFEGVPPTGVPQNAATGRLNGVEHLSAVCLGLNVSGNYDRRWVLL